MGYFLVFLSFVLFVLLGMGKMHSKIHIKIPIKMGSPTYLKASQWMPPWKRRSNIGVQIAQMIAVLRPAATALPNFDVKNSLITPLSFILTLI